jgi:hypothetical protein
MIDILVNLDEIDFSYCLNKIHISEMEMKRYIYESLDNYSLEEILNEEFGIIVEKGIYEIETSPNPIDEKWVTITIDGTESVEIKSDCVLIEIDSDRD